MKPGLIFLLTGILAAGVGLSGCASQPKVTRTDVQKTIDLSGRWNDTDSRLVAEEMINDCLKRPWLNKFQENNSTDPVVIVGMVKNRTSEHINSELFVKNLERSLLNSSNATGMIKVFQTKMIWNGNH